MRLPRRAPDVDTTCCSPCSTRAASSRSAARFWIVDDGTRRSSGSRCSRRRGGTSGSAPCPTTRAARWPRRSPRRSRAWSAKPRRRRLRGALRRTAPRRRSRRSRRSASTSSPTSSPSRPRAARSGSRTPADRPTLVEWARDFADETGHRRDDGGGQHRSRASPREQSLGVGRRRARVDGGRVRTPAAGVARVQRVYTPPERRGAGYATACVEHLSRVLTDRGLRCVLYTQLEQSDVERDLPPHRLRAGRRGARLRLRVTQPGGGGPRAGWRRPDRWRPGGRRAGGGGHWPGGGGGPPGPHCGGGQRAPRRRRSPPAYIARFARPRRVAPTINITTPPMTTAPPSAPTPNHASTAVQRVGERARDDHRRRDPGSGTHRSYSPPAGASNTSAPV